MRNRTCTCNAKCNVHVCVCTTRVCVFVLDFSETCVTCMSCMCHVSFHTPHFTYLDLYTVYPVLYADVYRTCMYFTVLTSQPHTDVFFHLFDLAIAECFIPFNWYPFILSLALLRRSAISSCRSLRRTSFSV